MNLLEIVNQLKLANLVGLVSLVIVAMMVKVLMSDSDTILVVHTLDSRVSMSKG